MKDTLKELLGSKRALLTLLAVGIVASFVLGGKMPAETAVDYLVKILGALGVSYAYSDTKPVDPKG
jgi:hypothetical protein